VDRYWKANTAIGAPTVPANNAGGYPADGDASAGIDGTVPGAWWFHSITEELRNAIVSLGGTPDWTQTDQLADAITDALSKAITSAAQTLTGATGAAQVGFTQAGAGAVIRTVQDELRRKVTISQYGATSGVDCSAALQAAIEYIETLGGNDYQDSGGTVELGPGLWYVNNVAITHFGVRLVGAGKYATLIANRSATDPMISVYQGNTAVTSTITEVGFEKLQFRNTVARADGAGPLLQGTYSERMLFSDVDFVSSPLAAAGNRSALRCDFLKFDTFESRWSHCAFWGVLGCAVDIPDGPQSDTLLFDHCVWAYCTLAVSLACGSASGLNGPQFVSCKIVGNQGGTYVSNGADSFAHTTIGATSNGNAIQVTDATNFAVDKCVLVGRNVPNPQRAFVRRVSGNTITLDRAVSVNAGDDVVHGVFGVVLGHVHTAEFRGVQLEGCDVGVYSTVGTLTTFSGSIGSTARPFLMNGEFRYLRVGPCAGFTIGTMKNGVPWQFVTVLYVADTANRVDLEDCDCEGSGYYSGSPGTLVINESGVNLRTAARSRQFGQQYAGTNTPVVTMLDTASLTFNRSADSTYSRTRYQTGGIDQWLNDYTRSGTGDLIWWRPGQPVSMTLYGANGIVQIGDSTWNGLPLRLGGYYVWVDSTGRLRIKSGSPSSDTDGTVVGTQS
jgi:hypothetical protein